VSVAKTREPASRRLFDFADIASHGLDEHHFTDTLQDDIAAGPQLATRMDGLLQGFYHPASILPCRQMQHGGEMRNERIEGS